MNENYTLESYYTSLPNLPTYQTKPHPELEFNRKCNKCANLTCGESVGFAGPNDISQVRLIVISDYSGAYETNRGWPQVPNSLEVAESQKKKRTPPFRNSGQLLRDSIYTEFGINSWSEVWMTNAVKCDLNYKGQKKNITDSNIKTCGLTWLEKEFALLDQYAPTAPTIIAGSTALKSMLFLYPKLQTYSKGHDLQKFRRKLLKVGNRPAIVTFNPAMPARNEMRLEQRVTSNRRSGKIEITEVKWWHPPMPMTPTWYFLKDLELLKEFV